MQSESVELWILLSWSDELTILFCLFVVVRAWPNSKYEDINETLYRPSIVPGGGAEAPPPPPRKTATDSQFAY